IQLSIKPLAKLTVNPGFHMMYLGLNHQAVVDPRLSIQYQMNPRHSVSASYGIHSKMLPLGSYFYKKDSSANYPNKDLAMMRAAHYIVGYDQLLGRSWRLHIEGYFQHLVKIPVVDDINRTYWLLNDLEGYAKE